MRTAGLIPLETRFLHNPSSLHGYVGAALSSNIIHFTKVCGLRLHPRHWLEGLQAGGHVKGSLLGRITQSKAGNSITAGPRAFTWAALETTPQGSATAWQTDQHQATLFPNWPSAAQCCMGHDNGPLQSFIAWWTSILASSRLCSLLLLETACSAGGPPSNCCCVLQGADGKWKHKVAVSQEWTKVCTPVLCHQYTHIRQVLVC